MQQTLLFIGGLGTQELLIIIFLAGLAVVVVVLVRAIASGLKDDQRKIVGGIALLVGIVLSIYGISSVNSTSSQLLEMAGRSDTGGMAAIGFGVLVAAIGIVIIASKSSKQGEYQQTSSSKKCPFCAETIQSEAKICRYCGKSLELPA